MDDQELRAVMFLPGSSNELFSSGATGSSQLDGVLELAQLAEASVLHDELAIAGEPVAQLGDVGEVLNREATTFKYLNLIGEGDHYPLNILPYYAASGTVDVSNEYKRLRKVGAPDSVLKVAGNKANEHQAWSYMMLADALNASYYPEREFGIEAIKTFPDVVHLSPHDPYGNFKDELRERMARSLHSDGQVSTTPSFFVEALRNAETFEGFIASVRQLHDSAAARHYRELVRTIRFSDPTSAIWRSASTALDKEAKAAFSNEGLPSRNSFRWIKPVVALTSLSLAYLFPPIAGALALPGIVVPTAIDEIDRYIRNRQNIFELYKETDSSDLFAELKRIFPHIKVAREHLTFFMSQKHFGWGKQLDELMYRTRKRGQS
jgi:hypothetical protein